MACQHRRHLETDPSSLLSLVKLQWKQISENSNNNRLLQHRAAIAGLTFHEEDGTKSSIGVIKGTGFFSGHPSTGILHRLATTKNDGDLLGLLWLKI